MLSSMLTKVQILIQVPISALLRAAGYDHHSETAVRAAHSCAVARSGETTGAIVLEPPFAAELYASSTPRVVATGQIGRLDAGRAR